MFYLFLYLEIAIRVLCLIILSLGITSSIYSIKTDKAKKKEINRLKELNDQLQVICDLPIKKAREFLAKSNDEAR